jgi:hypothetical protein
MKNKAALPWILIACFWTLGIFLTFINHQKVASIHAVRERNEQHRNGLVFKLRHAASLSRIMQIHQEMALPVESLQMGLLTTKSQLIRLGNGYDLQQMQITTKPETADGSRVPLAVHAAGSLPDMVRLLMVLQENPHLSVDHVQIQILSENRQAVLNLDLTLRYTIVSTHQENPFSIQSARFTEEGRM